MLLTLERRQTVNREGGRSREKVESVVFNYDEPTGQATYLTRFVELIFAMPPKTGFLRKNVVDKKVAPARLRAVAHYDISHMTSLCDSYTSYAVCEKSKVLIR